MMESRSAGLGVRGGHAVFVKSESSDVTRMVVADTAYVTPRGKSPFFSFVFTILLDPFILGSLSWLGL
jgi:hypothetical protein